MYLIDTVAVPGGSLGLIAVSLISWYLACSVYSWYRLRQIPGPFLATFSYLWIFNVSRSGRLNEIHQKLTKKYPYSLIRIGPNELSTDDPDLIRKMNNPKSSYGKSESYLGNRFNPYHPNMFIMLDPEPHDKMKAKIASAYSGRDTPGLEASVDDQVGNLTRLIRRKYISEYGDWRVFDLGKAASLFTLDVISLVSLGKEFGCLETDSDVHGFYSNLYDSLPMMSLTIDVPWIRNIFYSPTFLKLAGPKESDSKGIGKLMGVTNKIVRERFAPREKEEKWDMLGSFMRHGLTQTECESEALFMFIAGSDTTAAVIRIGLLHILSIPRVYQRLKQEIAAAIRDGKASSPITSQEAKQLLYLQAVIYESIRNRPVAQSLLYKRVPAGGDTIDGKFIPEGTSIGMNSPSLLRSEALFGKDANMFRPERFLELDEAARAEMQRNVELAFGHGRWMCAGKPLALMELNKIFFELLRAFDFQLVDSQIPMVSDGYVLWRDRGLNVIVTESDLM